MTEAPTSERVRTAEIIGSICLATDIGMGFPFEHGFHATLMAMRICDLLDVGPQTATETYYASMLTYTGCTTDAALGAQIFGGPQTPNVVPTLWGSTAERAAGLLRALPAPDIGTISRLTQITRRLPRMIRNAGEHQMALCEVGEMLADRLGLPRNISRLFGYLTERWDGRGVLGRAEGEEIPLALRIALLARDAAFQRVVAGAEHARAVIGARRGAGHDPELATLFASHAIDVFSAADTELPALDAVLGIEPKPHLYLEDGAIDRALAGMGDFADLLAPSFGGHSSGVAAIVAATATGLSLSDAEATLARRAALVHDIGRVGVDVRIWERPGPLTADGWEAVRLHPYLTERTLAPSPFLSEIAAAACGHHERLDGSGYHRGSPARMLSRPARLVATADAFHAMTEPRPHRPPLSHDEAARILAAQADAGQMDPEMVGAVIEAGGYEVPSLPSPVGLTQRETQVIGLVARGLQTKQIARRLGISPKTADSHVQNAYRKMGVSTRAAATLFAMEHGLIASGEFPISE